MPLQPQPGRLDPRVLDALLKPGIAQHRHGTDANETHDGRGGSACLNSSLPRDKWSPPVGSRFARFAGSHGDGPRVEYLEPGAHQSWPRGVADGRRRQRRGGLRPAPLNGSSALIAAAGSRQQRGRDRLRRSPPFAAIDLPRRSCPRLGARAFTGLGSRGSRPSGWRGSDAGGCGLATRPGPGAVRSGLPRERHRRRLAAAAHLGRPEGAWRGRPRPPQAPSRCDRRAVRGRGAGAAAARAASACGRGIPAAQRRAAATHRGVRRSRRLDRARRPARPRGDARGAEGIPGRGGGRDRALRGARREVHGRRRARLFRLAAGA